VGILSLVVAAALAVSFGVGEWLVGTRHDHPRVRDGRGYTKWGRVPVTHHIPESFAFLFTGWGLQAGFALERPLFPSAPLPSWLVWVMAVGFAAVTYLQAPVLQKKYNLPDEPPWHLWLVLCVLAASLLLGFYLPWPQF
jgi:hypothetical protein